MTTITRNLYLTTAKMDASKVRLVFFAISLVMLVVAAGAPQSSGDFMR